ncbi:hypothetical protein BJ166DRAFT_205576 [Pestalotiopsis sp. NC0098]|nr:hypothetical protein BJ166DRAFT_205576 [Pestalotiopsis sp. NC0098]
MATASTQASTASGSRETAISQDHENDSDYEYEYSTTETETYYVTLDISKADFVARPQATLPSGRGSYKERAFTDVSARRPDGIVDTCKQKPKKTQTHPEKAAIITEAEEQAEQQAEQNKPPQNEAEDQIDINDFQILELHSEHPLIAYRGRVYEGHWARNIGTEFLFAKRNEDSPLPAIRQLDKGVDLLAASSARIMLTEMAVKPYDTKGYRTLKDRYENGGDLSGSESEAIPAVPDPEPGASAERYEQGDFLSKLIALKKQKGETDEVTVIARLHEEGKKKAGAKKPKVPRRRGRKQTNPDGPGRGRGRGRGSRGGRGGAGTGRAKGDARSRNADQPGDESVVPEPSNVVSAPVGDKDAPPKHQEDVEMVDG